MGCDQITKCDKEFIFCFVYFHIFLHLYLLQNSSRMETERAIWNEINTDFDPEEETANFGTRHALEAEGNLYEVGGGGEDDRCII
jgi:hypothetical protein